MAFLEYFMPLVAMMKSLTWI